MLLRYTSFISKAKGGDFLGSFLDENLEYLFTEINDSIIYQLMGFSRMNQTFKLKGLCLDLEIILKSKETLSSRTLTF